MTDLQEAQSTISNMVSIINKFANKRFFIKTEFENTKVRFYINNAKYQSVEINLALYYATGILVGMTISKPDSDVVSLEEMITILENTFLKEGN